MARQRKESALLAISQNKSFMAAIHVAAGRIKMGTEALDHDMTRMKRSAEEKESEKANKKVMHYTIAKIKQGASDQSAQQTAT
jgi:hypothetical protein